MKEWIPDASVKESIVDQRSKSEGCVLSGLAEGDQLGGDNGDIPGINVAPSAYPSQPCNCAVYSF